FSSVATTRKHFEQIVSHVSSWFCRCANGKRSCLIIDNPFLRMKFCQSRSLPCNSCRTTKIGPHGKPFVSMHQRKPIQSKRRIKYLPPLDARWLPMKSRPVSLRKDLSSAWDVLCLVCTNQHAGTSCLLGRDSLNFG